MDELRTAPQNIEAEQGVLAAMMLGDERAIDEIINYLVPEDFYREAHRVIYGHMQELHRAGKAIDNITLIDSLRNANKLEDIGGIAYITSIAASVPTTANIKYHADIVRDKSRLRRMIAAGTEIARMGYEPDTDNIQELLDRAEAQMLNVAQSNNNTEFTPINSIVLNISNLVTELSDQKNLLIGIPTNIRDLDMMTSGLQPSDFIILAARPSMGKTALALNIAANVAIRGRNKDGNRLTVAIFSLEMSKEQLVNRLLCSEAAIDSMRLRTGGLKTEEFDRFWDHANILSNSNIYIDDTGGLTSLEIRSRARRLKAEKGLDLLIIDYLQLMQGSGKRYRSEDSRQAEVSEISRSLKALARELNIPIIALSQLSRAVESRQDKRPLLSDLRESGSLEQDADIVAFLYREDYYKPDTDNPNITELRIAKHRNGATGTVNLFFEKQFTRFRDLSKRPE
ncbi:MAG: replicative DNA helicase [Acidaminococcaceae bacterium]|nr:replicative DNA helicase [Acidaminococcaceae bacterium]